MSDVVHIVKQELENALSIADVRGDIKVLNNEMAGMREQQKSHHASTQTALGEVNEKLDELFTVMNKGKGMFTIALMAAGAVGAGVVKFITYAFAKLAP